MLSGHPHRRKHFGAVDDALRADFRADFAMLVHMRMAFAFRRASAAEGDAGRELGLQKLAMADLVGAGQNAAGGVAHRRAILIEPDAGDQPLDTFFGKAGIGAGSAGLHAGKAGFNASGERIGVAWLIRMRPEHRSDGYSGHRFVPLRALPQSSIATHPSADGSGLDP